LEKSSSLAFDCLNLHAIAIPLKKLLINGRFLSQRPSGVQVYAYALCKELHDSGIDFSFLVPKKAQIEPPDYEVEIHRWGNLDGHLWEQIELPYYIRKQDAFLLNLCNSGPIRLKNQATVVHDLAFFKNPSWFHPAFAMWYRFMIPRMARNCKQVLTVSNSIKSELVETLSIPVDSITVLGNKVDNRLLQANAKPPEGLPEGFSEFYLMVGTNDPRKNFEFAASCISEQLNKKVVMVGGNHRNFRQTVTKESNNLIRVGHISLENLKWLYMNASALVSPSLYEGFGIPNLEAMALECPIICSDIPVFREVCDKAALYFNPLVTAELKACIETVEVDLNGRKERQSLGKAIFTSYQTEDRAKLISSIIKQ
jgi:glycosyltransferase involved in cell wall biosynthesis